MESNAKKKSRLRHVRIAVYFLPIIAILAGYGAIIGVTHEPYPFTLVTGTSMKPTILPGSIALIDKVPFNQLQVGDIIVFRPQISMYFPCDGSPSSSLTSETPVPCFIIHRIASISTNNQGNIIIETKGDNNPISLPNYDTNINSSMYFGKVVLQFPILGYITVPPYNEGIALVIFIALLLELYLDRKASGRLARRASIDGSQLPSPS